MPSFYPSSQHRSLSLTPPDYLQAYNNRDCGRLPLSAMPYAQQYATYGRQEKACYDPTDRYRQQSGYSSGSMLYQQQHLLPNVYNHATTAAQHNQSQYYGAIGAPVLPPVRVPDPIMLDDYAEYSNARDHRPSIERQQKQEKPVGGVAAHLDYEMDQMTDFVAEMSQGIVLPNSPVSPAFRKFVSQILSSTRLPSSTILLALYYLATRMNMLSATGTYKASSSQVYRMLTIALLLGSKFLDDNTFQNRSWSEVSGLPVTELNSMEVEWLVAIGWNLHTNPYEHQGFMSWKAHWDTWRAKVVSQSRRSQSAVKASAIDTTPERQQTLQRQTYSPAASAIHLPPFSKALPEVSLDRRASQYQLSSRFDPWNYASPSIDRSPPSAPESGPNTPEYLGLQEAWPFGHTAHSQAQSSGALSSTGRTTLPSFPVSYMPTHSQDYSRSWQHHAVGCGCAYCSRPHEAYFMPTGYGAQTVMG